MITIRPYYLRGKRTTLRDHLWAVRVDGITCLITTTYPSWVFKA
jgi:hypothetical protein